MSKTKLLAFGVAVIMLMSFRNPGNPGQFQAAGYSDTIEQKATGDKAQATTSAAEATKQAATQAANLQSGFKDLFIMTGNNGAKLNSRAVGFVQDYMEKNSRKLENMKSWGRPYFNMIDGILIKHGLPKELKYLAVIESELKPAAVSWAGAVGPWQLMPATARALGLKVSKRIDER